MGRALVLAAALTACATSPQLAGRTGCEQLAREAGHELSDRVDSYPIAHTTVRILTWLPVDGRPVAECTLQDGRVVRMRVGGQELTPPR